MSSASLGFCYSTLIRNMTNFLPFLSVFVFLPTGNIKGGYLTSFQYCVKNMKEIPESKGIKNNIPGLFKVILAKG